MSEQQSADSRHRGNLLRQWGPAVSLLVVAVAVAGTLLLSGEDELRTPTLRPAERICDASAAPPIASLEDLDAPEALLFGDEIVHLPPGAAERVRFWIERFGDSRFRDRLQRYFHRVHVRAPEVRPVLRDAGVPEEMIYLMLVESGGNPEAVSSARAVGLWQFMSHTARAMDLSVTPYYDTRRQPEASTRAAARYLKQMHDEFGSWWLAMAAYNAGPSRVRGALRRAPGADYFELSDRKLLPPSTREYVPKTLAALLIGRDPVRWGFAASFVRQTPRRFGRLTVASGTTWEALAEATEVPEGWLRRLNPEYPLDLVVAPDSARVLVPRGRARRADARLASMPEDRRLGMLRHTVRPGETLGEIAARYGMPLDRVLAINDRVDPRRLSVGQQLHIPAGR